MVAMVITWKQIMIVVCFHVMDGLLFIDQACISKANTIKRNFLCNNNHDNSTHLRRDIIDLCAEVKHDRWPDIRPLSASDQHEDGLGRAQEATRELDRHVLCRLGWDRYRVTARQYKLVGVRTGHDRMVNQRLRARVTQLNLQYRVISTIIIWTIIIWTMIITIIIPKIIITIITIIIIIIISNIPIIIIPKNNNNINNCKIIIKMNIIHINLTSYICYLMHPY